MWNNANASPFLSVAKMSSKKCIFWLWKVRIIVKQHMNKHRAYTVFPSRNGCNWQLLCFCPPPHRAAGLTHVWINVRLDGFTSRRHTVSQDDCARSRISGWTVAILCARQAYAMLHSCSFTWAYVLLWWNSGLLKFTGPERSGGGRSQTVISHKQEIFPSIRAPLS